MIKPGLLSAVLFSAALCAQGLDVAVPIDQLSCRAYRSNEIRIWFIDAKERQITFVINDHFLNGDGRVYRSHADGQKISIGAEKTRALTRLLSDWWKDNVSEEQQKQLAIAGKSDWSDVETRLREIRDTIKRLESLPESKLQKPVLIHKDPRGLVHAIDSMPRIDGVQRTRAISPGIALTYTDRESGEMSYLLATGVVAVPTRRVTYSESRVVGIHTDEERLYVALWYSGRLFDLRSKRREGTYFLFVFWLDDGGKIDKVSIPREGIPDDALAETTTVGPLANAEGGVALFGRDYCYDGKRRAKR